MIITQLKCRLNVIPGVHYFQTRSKPHRALEMYLFRTLTYIEGPTLILSLLNVQLNCFHNQTINDTNITSKNTQSNELTKDAHGHVYWMLLFILSFSP